MKDSKNLVIGMLCAVVCIMAVAYAAFSTQLNVNGTATISSEWNVAYEASFADCELTSAAGGTKGVTANVERKSDTVATVSMTFTQPGDYAVCTINVVNNGTLDAKLNFDTSATTETELVRFTLTGTDEADKALVAKGQHTITVKGEFLDKKVEGTSDSVAITDANKTASLSIITTATQNLG